jgi:hypothetical protein
MRRSTAVSLLVLALLLVPAAPGFAWHGHPGFRTHVFVGVGPSFWWGPYWWYYPPPPYVVYAPPPPYVYAPPPVVVQAPPVYVQPEPPPPAAAPEGYWYYCPSAKVYYPDVPQCAEAWIKVPPRPR